MQARPQVPRMRGWQRPLDGGALRIHLPMSTTAPLPHRPRPEQPPHAPRARPTLPFPVFESKLAHPGAATGGGVPGRAGQPPAQRALPAPGHRDRRGRVRQDDPAGPVGGARRAAVRLAVARRPRRRPRSCCCATWRRPSTGSRRSTARSSPRWPAPDRRSGRRPLRGWPRQWRRAPAPTCWCSTARTRCTAARPATSFRPCWTRFRTGRRWSSRAVRRRPCRSPGSGRTTACSSWAPWTWPSACARPGRSCRRRASSSTRQTSGRCSSPPRAGRQG